MPRLLLLALLFVSLDAHSETVPLVRAGGTYLVPVTINRKISLNFTVDSGASEVCVPADVYSTLKRADTISAADSLDDGVYELADGSRQTNQRFRIHSLRVGEVELHDVTGSVCSAGSSLLLGQSFLGRLSSWSIDNSKHVLIIGGSEASPASTTNAAAATDTTAPGNAGGYIAPAPAPQVEKTRYEEVTSKWPMKGITVLIDLTHVTYDYGNIRRAWLWLMVGQDAKQKVNEHGHMQSYRYLLAFDCNSNRLRADFLVERYETGDFTWSNEKLTGRISKWNKVSSEDYPTVAMRKVCSLR
jgi:clan AA aspartic protease (TIGR02281 family)